MRSSAWLRLDARDPRGHLPVGKASGVEILVTHPYHRDPHEVAQLQLWIRCDVDTVDRKRPVETDPPQRPMGLVTESASHALVEGHSERRGAVGAKAHEREAAPDVAAKHR